MRAGIRIIIEACKAQKQRTDLYLDPPLFRQLIEDTRALNYRDGVYLTYSYYDPAGVHYVRAHGTRIYPKGYDYIIPNISKG